MLSGHGCRYSHAATILFGWTAGSIDIVLSRLSAWEAGGTSSVGYDTLGGPGTGHVRVLYIIPSWRPTSATVACAVGAVGDARGQQQGLSSALRQCGHSAGEVGLCDSPPSPRGLYLETKHARLWLFRRRGLARTPQLKAWGKGAMGRGSCMALGQHAGILR